MNNPLGVSPSKGKQGTTRGKRESRGRLINLSSPTFSVRPCGSVGRVTVDLIRSSWVRFPPRSKDFFFASCCSLFPFSQWVIHGFKEHYNLHFRVNYLFHYWQKGRVKRRQSSIHVYPRLISMVIRKFKLSSISSPKIPRIGRAQPACRLWTQKMEIFNSRGPKQIWHQNEATPRESKRKCSHKGANEAFCLKYKRIATRAHWSCLVRVDRWGLDSAETLLPITQPHEGDWGKQRRGSILLS